MQSFDKRDGHVDGQAISLLVLDDLGAERETSLRKNSFAIIDTGFGRQSTIRSTNLSLDDIKNPASMVHDASLIACLRCARFNSGVTDEADARTP